MLIHTNVVQGQRAGEVPTEEILAYSRLFKDELTLDNLSREQLKACCRLLGITPYVAVGLWNLLSPSAPPPFSTNPATQWLSGSEQR